MKTMEDITWNDFKNAIEDKLAEEGLTGDIRLDHINWSTDMYKKSGHAKPKIALEEEQIPWLCIS